MGDQWRRAESRVGVIGEGNSKALGGETRPYEA